VLKAPWIGRISPYERRASVKKQISPAMIAVVVAVVVLIIGVIAFKTFGGNPADQTATPEQIKGVQQMRNAAMAPGVHRDANGHFVDAQGNPVNLSAAPTRGQ
jgi:Tfp pilus assembly protein PilV